MTGRPTMPLSPPCPRRWGHLLFRCKASPDRRHQCLGTRGHVAVHKCGWCGALLIVGLL